MIVHIERTGGFTGIPQRLSADSEALGPSEGQTLKQLVQSCGFFDLPARLRGSAGGADRFQYVVTVEDGGRTYTVEGGESDLPDPLRQLVQYVTRLARG